MTVKVPLHVCVQMAIRIIHIVILHYHPCRHRCQFQSLLFLFPVFPTHFGYPFDYYFFVPSYVCTISYSICYSYIQYLYSQYSFRLLITTFKRHEPKYQSFRDFIGIFPNPYYYLLFVISNALTTYPKVCQCAFSRVRDDVQWERHNMTSVIWDGMR